VTTPAESSTPRVRYIIYGVVAAVVVILMVVGLFAWHRAKSDRDAEAKADQLIAALDVAGARTPSREQVVRVLGNDGGLVCANPNEFLNRAAMLGQLANGAGGPGSRPVIADSRAAKGELLVISVYCPEQLPAFQDFVNSLRTEDVSG
jgi:hypothetical protein